MIIHCFGSCSSKNDKYLFMVPSQEKGQRSLLCPVNHRPSIWLWTFIITAHHHTLTCGIVTAKYKAGWEGRTLFWGGFAWNYCKSCFPESYRKDRFMWGRTLTVFCCCSSLKGFLASSISADRFPSSFAFFVNHTILLHQQSSANETRNFQHMVYNVVVAMWDLNKSALKKWAGVNTFWSHCKYLVIHYFKAMSNKKNSRKKTTFYFTKLL